MISVFSSSPHLSLAIPTYASLSLGWSPTHQIPCVSFHDCVFDNLGRACAADVAISNAATPAKSTRVFIGYFGTRSYPVLRFVARYTRYGGPGYAYGPGPYPDAVIVNPVTGRWCRTESNGYLVWRRCRATSCLSPSLSPPAQLRLSRRYNVCSEIIAVAIHALPDLC